MPAADSTLVSLPPQSVCFVSGASANDWNASICSPHFAQRYTYVGMDAPSGRRVAGDWHSTPTSANRTCRRRRGARRVLRSVGQNDGHGCRRAPRTRGLVAGDVPERATRRPGPRPRHPGRGLGQPGRLERPPAAGLAGGGARAAGSTSPRARPPPAPGWPSAAGRARASSGVAAVVGHTYPLYRKGGKGVAAAGGALSCSTRSSSLGLARGLVPRRPGAAQGVARVAAEHDSVPRGCSWSSVTTDGKSESSAALALLVVVRHTANIRRLFRREEIDLGAGRSARREEAE